jgi:hypothetical protein
MSAGIKANVDGSGAIQVGGTDVITISSAGAVAIPQSLSVAGSLNTPNTFGFKNRIINGAMMIDQRNAGASVTPTITQYTVDRFYGVPTQASKFSVQQNAGSVTPPAGFKNYLGVTSLSAYSVLTGDTFYIGQSIEGFNVSDLGFGTANAQPVTISFWVRSSLTGTFGGSLSNATGRSYPFSYTISTANTWEQKSVTILGDTSGTWLTNNGVGLAVWFGLGSGSTYSGTAGAWASSVLVQPTGSVSVVGTNGATFYITGVQLEKGSTATSFDYRPYGQELALCQRYYALVDTMLCFTNAGTTVEVVGTIQYPVSMRSSPTLGLTSVAKISDTAADFTQSSINITVAAAGRISSNASNIRLANFTGLTGFRPAYLITGQSSITCAAEL